MTLGSWGPDDFSAAAAVGGLFVALAAAVFLFIQVRQARDLRHEQARPYVVVDFEFRRQLVSIAVTNIGATPARDVVITFDRPLEATSSRRGDINESTMFTAPIPMMAPGRKMVIPFDVGANLFKPDAGVSLTYTATVKYRGDRRRDNFVDDYPLDLLPYKDTASGGRGVHELALSVQEISAQLKSLTSSGHLRVKAADEDLEKRREHRGLRVYEGRRAWNEGGVRRFVRWFYDDVTWTHGWR